MKNSIKIIPFILLASFMQISSASSLSLNELQDLDFQFSENGEAPSSDMLKKVNLRLRAMKTAALSYGAQHGYYFYTKKLRQEIKNHSSELDKIFDFSTLMRLSSGGESDLYLLPPSIRESSNLITSSEEGKKLRVSGTYYEIYRPARLVINPPNWRQYLIYNNNTSLKAPAKSIRPKNSSEKSKWKSWISQGWKAGMRQADREMRFRIHRLGNDYVGMVKYMVLVEEGKVTKPEVSIRHHMVSGGGREMRENDSFVELLSPGSLDNNPSNWKPLVGDDRKGLRLERELNEYR